MLAILKLLPLKDWCYLAVIVALVAAFAYYTHHERALGAQTIITLDRAAVAKQAAAVAKVESNASQSISAAQAAYAAAVAARPAPVAGLVCHLTAPRRAVPHDARATGGGNDTASVPVESTGPAFNPSAGILENDARADAQVTLLQSYVRACQAAGVCKP